MTHPSSVQALVSLGVSRLPHLNPLPLPADLPQQLAIDQAALREIVAGLERVGAEVQWALDNFQTLPRGYFTPDEDDRVRHMLLAYRGYRSACYALLEHWTDYAAIPGRDLAVEAFTTAYATALSLYAHTLGLLEAFEGEPLIRAKINEPDPKFEVPEGFFEELLDGYSSPINLLYLTKAHWTWHQWRRDIQAHSRRHPDRMAWMVELIRRHQHRIRRQFWGILRTRFRFDLRLLRRLAGAPARRTAWGLQAVMGRSFAGGKPRRSAIGHPTLAALLPQLRTGDILLVRAEGRLTTTLIPGFWSHAAFCLRSRRDLDALGLGGHPFVVRHQQQIPAEPGPYGHVLEAKSPQVAIHPLETCLAAEHAAVLRPRISDAERGQALAEALGHLGKPYDFEFDFNVANRLVCTELIYRALHGREGIAFELVKRLGRYTLTGDDLVEQALSGPSRDRFDLVALVLTDSAGRPRFIAEADLPSAHAALIRGWRPARDPWPAFLEAARA